MPVLQIIFLICWSDYVIFNDSSCSDAPAMVQINILDYWSWDETFKKTNLQLHYQVGWFDCGHAHWNLKSQTILWYLLHTKNMHRLVWCRTVFSNKTKTYHGSPWRRQRWLSHPDACKCYLLRCRIWSRSLRWLHTIQNTADTVGTGVMSKGLGQKFSRGLGMNETKKRIGFNVSK